MGNSLPPQTTVQDDLIKAGQRRINLIWEVTQAILSVSITTVFLYSAIKGLDAPELTWAFISVVTAYIVRTNHQAIGGVGPQPKKEEYKGR